MKTVVIYHKADFDGIFCREIASKFLPDATMIGWDYGDPLIDFPREGTVYVLDLSPDCFNRDTNLIANDRLVWIDHHASAIRNHSAQIPGYRIDGVAACRLAWQWFSEDHTDFVVQCSGLPDKQAFVDGDVTEPIAVRLAGEYDVWDKRDPDAELFQHGLSSVPLTDGIWEELLEPRNIPNLVRKLLDKGEAVQYAKTQENKSIIKASGFIFQFEGLIFLACNHARYNSHLFTAGLKPEHDACFGFAWRDEHWNVSLYHAPGKEHHDLSLIAVKYGGGGHRGACGFRVKSLPFLE